MADGGSCCSKPPRKAIALGTHTNATAAGTGTCAQTPLPRITPVHFWLQGTGTAMPSSAHGLPTNLKEYFQSEPGEYLCQSEHSEFQYPRAGSCVSTEVRSSAELSAMCNFETEIALML